VDKNGNKRVDEVRFSWCEITPDAIYYKVAASHRAMFGGWKTHLPYGVRIFDLTKDETLYELSLSCQRQVTAKTSPTGGAWIIVHRLDTNDGLVNQVRYTSVMEHYPRKYRAKLPICVGVGLNLNVIWLNIADYPHMLIAGFTGSGKSNFINAIICTLITQHSPEDVRIVLVDLKDGVEFSAYENIPHLHGKVVDTVSDLAGSLQELEAIMSDRNKQLKGKAKSLAQYNMKYPDKPLPRIICIIDEVASIMNQGDSTKRINHSLRQLTAKGRAPGVHIILCTQRPTVDVIDGGVKVNLAARIVGRMPSTTDSQAVLGSGDAKDLAAVPGRMLLQISPDPQPVQTPFIEEEDVAIALKRASEWETPAPLPVPEGFNQAAEWTPEKIVELSLKHLGGNISHIAVWEEIKDEGALTRSQLRPMVEKIWQQDCIPFEGKQYKVERGKGKIRKLVEIVESPDSLIEMHGVGMQSEGNLIG
ncbi:MAG TPA: FtsK/SpoIIIE domain-containing protein, partial [Terriglobales bacterium]|nr:FtsK/SpoIIIE domain-containing protein [Terriglobales bacterium]